MFGESATVNLRPVDKKGAPITEDWARCPPPRLGRIVFSHCRDLVGDAGHPGTGGAWDRERVLAETYYECVAGCRITGRELLTADHADLAAITGATLGAALPDIVSPGTTLTLQLPVSRVAPPVPSRPAVAAHPTRSATLGWCSSCW